MPRFDVHKNTVSDWETKFTQQKTALVLYARCHQFIQLTFEDDELYTVVGKRAEAADSQGWTAVIMERASRFIIEQQCGEKDAEMFHHAMNSVADYIKCTDEVTFLSDGERRYGNALFDLCSDVIRDGRRGRSPSVLPKGVKVRSRP